MLSEFGRRHAKLLLEAATEIARVFDSYFVGYFGDSEVSFAHIF